MTKTQTANYSYLVSVLLLQVDLQLQLFWMIYGEESCRDDKEEKRKQGRIVHNP